MSVLYLPGCTLKNKAANFDRSFTAAMDKLDVDVRELERWNCCGTVFSMTGDDLMQQLAPVRNLLRAEQQGAGPLLVPCSMCYNTLARAKRFVDADPERRRKLNDFMYDEEGDYSGRMQVVHPLAYLRDAVGWQQLRQRVTRPLSGLKVGAYYGCLLLRPEEVAIDDVARPRVIGELLQAIGAEPVDFALQHECCGSYQTLTNLAVVTERTRRLLQSARAAGAESLVTSCPLCAYNLDQMQREAVKQHAELERMPVFYFSELLALALGVAWEADWSGRHEVDPASMLQSL
jgi:heterodisulfide reductase subunit B